MSEDRTEQPTSKKRQEARDEGKVARSRDLAMAGASVAATIALARLGGRLMHGLGERLAGDLSHFGDAPLRSITEGEMTALVIRSGSLIGMLVGPIAIATMAAGVMVHGFQGGFAFAPKALKLNWSSLNPATGLQRLAPKQSGIDTLKTLLSVAAISYLGWVVINATLNDAIRMAWMRPFAAAQLGWSHAESLLWRVAWALGLLAIGDYALQRYRLTTSLKMTKQEVKDEAKLMEGNAEVKGRIRRIQREMSRRRMISDVKRATVVITNPTHYAVALEYKRGTMAAPMVLAKGADHVAATIREEARKHGVPMVENKPLAQALFKTAEVGEAIPGNLFAAVAEVLAQLIRLKQLVL